MAAARAALIGDEEAICVRDGFSSGREGLCAREGKGFRDSLESVTLSYVHSSHFIASTKHAVATDPLVNKNGNKSHNIS